MVSETHLIQLIFKYKYVENIREIGKGYKDKLFLSGQWRSACEKDEMTSFQVIPLSMSILIFFLSFFSWLFVCLTGFLICFVFFKMPVKINEKGWLKRLALFFFEDYFLPEKKEPQPLWWLLVQHLPQQFCSCPLTAVSSAYLRVLHVRMQTNKSLFNRGSSHTCTVRSSQYHLFNWSCRKTHQVQIWSHYTVQSPSATWHSYGKVWLPFAGLCQSSWKYCLSHSKEAAEIELLQGGWLAVILKLDNVLLWNLCITYTIIFVTII